MQILSDWGHGEIELHAVSQGRKAGPHEHSSTASSRGTQETMGSRWGGYRACEASDNAQLSTLWQEVISFFFARELLLGTWPKILAQGVIAVRRSAGRGIRGLSMGLPSRATVRVNCSATVHPLPNTGVVRHMCVVEASAET